MSATDKRVPVTVLTGFLGSGKTTLLNHLLTENHGKKLAIIENEFGEVGVDEVLLDKKAGGRLDTSEEIVEVINGCVCCTVRGDLVKILKKLLIQRKLKLDGIIIETTGLADPAPVAQTFFVDEDVSKRCRLDGIITVVDAKHILQHLDEVKPEGVENESVEQIAFADRILLNKVDLVDAEHIAKVKERIKSINASVPIIETQRSKVSPADVMNIKGFDLDKVLENEPDFLAEDAEHQHDTTVSSISFKIEEPVVLMLLEQWISELMKTKGNDLFRYKGVISVAGMEQRFVFQGVHMLFGGEFAGSWAPGEERESRFVFIGKNLDKPALEKGFLNCVAKPLRFKVGDKVIASCHSGTEPGVVIKLWDDGNAYRVRLDSGDDVWAPVDEDDFICIEETKARALPKQCPGPLTSQA